MPIFDLFSKRRAIEIGAVSDIYQYDEVPDKLRVQIVHIFNEAIGTEEDYHSRYGVKNSQANYDTIVYILRKEYGVFKLGGVDQRRASDKREEFINHILSCSTDQFLDALELGTRAIDFCPTSSSHREVCEEAVLEINIRLREASFGYQFESGRIIRVDTEYAHQEITKPALSVLNAQHLEGAREEFLSAHTHYRERRYKECISECLKTFESTMKSICAKHNWPVAENATARTLIDACFANQLIPDYMRAEFSALRAILEAGVPTTRNRTSGHGQGIVPLGVPDHLAAFVLHQTAAALIFLDKSDASLS